MKKEHIQFQNDIITVYVDEKNGLWFYHKDISEKFGLKWKTVYGYIAQNFNEKEKGMISLNSFIENRQKVIISITGILHLAHRYKIKDNKFLDWIKEMEIKNKNQNTITKNKDEEEHLLIKVNENEITKEESNVKENNDTINNNKDDGNQFQFKKLCDELFIKYKEKEEENAKLKNVLKHIKNMIADVV